MVSALRTLEDYVTAMATRNDDADLQRQLLDKERDLMMAAQIGKDLLDKNAELSRQNERITEEYTQKLEVSWDFENLKFFSPDSAFAFQCYIYY